jgi:hypothetical protein
MSNLQPTGILARVNIQHEKGGRLEATSLNARIIELGIAPTLLDGSTNLKIGTELELSGKRYQIIDMSLQFRPELDSASVPNINPNTYFTDTNEPLPVNLFIHLIVRSL